MNLRWTVCFILKQTILTSSPSSLISDRLPDDPWCLNKQVLIRCSCQDIQSLNHCQLFLTFPSLNPESVSAAVITSTKTRNQVLWWLINWCIITLLCWIWMLLYWLAPFCNIVWRSAVVAPIFKKEDQRVSALFHIDSVRSWIIWEGLRVEPLLLHIERIQLSYLGLWLGRLLGEVFRNVPLAWYSSHFMHACQQ